MPRIDEELQHAGRWMGQLVHVRRDGTRVVVQSCWELGYEEQTTGPTILEVNCEPTTMQDMEQSSLVGP